MKLCFFFSFCPLGAIIINRPSVLGLPASIFVCRYEHPLMFVTFLNSSLSLHPTQITKALIF